MSMARRIDEVPPDVLQKGAEGRSPRVSGGNRRRRTVGNPRPNSRQRRLSPWIPRSCESEWDVSLTGPAVTWRCPAIIHIRTYVMGQENQAHIGGQLAIVTTIFRSSSASRRRWLPTPATTPSTCRHCHCVAGGVHGVPGGRGGSRARRSAASAACAAGMPSASSVGHTARSPVRKETAHEVSSRTAVPRQASGDTG